MAGTAARVTEDASSHRTNPRERGAVTPERMLARAVRDVAIEAVDTAGCGDLALAIGMADVASVLWSRFLQFDAADPRWPDRDRFVLSAGQASVLLHALLRLSGHDQSDFQEESPREASPGPRGQGLASAVGMAIAERLMAARFGRSLVDHRIWVIASADELMDGLSHEAAELAGLLRLDRLTILYDDAGAPDGAREAASGDPLKRFAAGGWAVKSVDGHDPAQIAAALSFAMRSRKPTLIACTTVLGAALHNGHGSDGDATREPMGRDDDEAPDPVTASAWRAAGRRGASRRRAWLKRMARHPQRVEFERAHAGRLPDALRETIAGVKAALSEARGACSTRTASLLVLEAVLPALPDLVLGAAVAGGSERLQPRGTTAVTPGSFAGRLIPYGPRVHAMAAAMNGMALHGGLIACGETPLLAADSMRPALRQAALMGRRLVHVLPQDKAQPAVEHLAGWRAMPRLHVFRPADAIETAECWELALRRGNGPSLLVVAAEPVPALRLDIAENRCGRGGYVLAEAEGARQASLIATGPEVALAMAARAMLAAEGMPVAVISLPCWELFAQQDESFREAVLGAAPRIGIEAACGFGWERWLGCDGVFVGLTGDAAGGHAALTPDAVAMAVRRRAASP